MPMPIDGNKFIDGNKLKCQNYWISLDHFSIFGGATTILDG
jgi:hypothetical protein